MSTFGCFRTLTCSTQWTLHSYMCKTWISIGWRYTCGKWWLQHVQRLLSRCHCATIRPTAHVILDFSTVNTPVSIKTKKNAITHERTTSVKKTHKSASVGCVISGSPSWLKLKFGFDVNINSTLSIRSFRLVSSKSALQVSLKQASTTIYPSVCPSVYKCQLQVSAPFYVSSNNLCDWLRVNPCDLQLCVMTVGHRQMSEQILASSIF